MRKIVCAANKHKETGILILGARHFDGLMREMIENLKLENKNQYFEQGFIDNKGKFLTRKQAFVIAQNADQIITKNTDTYGTLYSEDLY